VKRSGLQDFGPKIRCGSARGVSLTFSHHLPRSRRKLPPEERTLLSSWGHAETTTRKPNGSRRVERWTFVERLSLRARLIERFLKYL
jgi:hypothetical protein